jgi:hypothetical protein
MRTCKENEINKSFCNYFSRSVMKENSKEFILRNLEIYKDPDPIATNGRGNIFLRKDQLESFYKAKEPI